MDIDVGNYDITIYRNRTLNYTRRVDVFENGCFLYPFCFDAYTGATLEVRTKASDFNRIISFSTDDGSLVLDTDGVFHLIKSDVDLKNIRAGEFLYDMYVQSEEAPKEQFIQGNFIIEETVSK